MTRRRSGQNILRLQGIWCSLKKLGLMKLQQWYLPGMMVLFLLVTPSFGLIIAMGVATSGLVVSTDGNGKASAGPAVKIMGTKATLTIPHPIFRPTEYTVHPHGSAEPERHVLHIPGKGMHWQADATARAIRNFCLLLLIDV